MEKSKIEAFIITTTGYFPPEATNSIITSLEKTPEERFLYIQTADYRNPIMMLAISFLVGTLGVDRFLLGQTGLGIFKLLTCGACGFWALVDLFLIMGLTRKYNYEKFVRSVS